MTRLLNNINSQHEFLVKLNKQSDILNENLGHLIKSNKALNGTKGNSISMNAVQQHTLT
jgi:hypothetical protein